MTQNSRLKYSPHFPVLAVAVLLVCGAGPGVAGEPRFEPQSDPKFALGLGATAQPELMVLPATEPVTGLLYFTPRNTHFGPNLGRRGEACSFISPEVPGASCYTFDAMHDSGAENGGLNDGIALGVAYQNRIRNIDLDLSTTVVSGAQDPNLLSAVAPELQSWKLDFSAGYTGFTFSTSFAEDRARATGGRDEFATPGGQEVFDLGVKYDQGPWELGVQYSHSELDTLSIGPQIGDQKIDAYEIGGSYLMGPRLSLGAAIQFWKWDEFAGSAGDEDHKSDLLFLIGSRLKF